jgi:hypothetical protein
MRSGRSSLPHDLLSGPISALGSSAFRPAHLCNSQLACAAVTQSHIIAKTRTRWTRTRQKETEASLMGLGPEDSIRSRSSRRMRGIRSIRSSSMLLRSKIATHLESGLDAAVPHHDEAAVPYPPFDSSVYCVRCILEGRQGIRGHVRARVGH